MEKERRKILRQAKSYFSETEYKKYFQALKTLELHKVSLERTFVIQDMLFSILPEFNIAYASLFIEQTQISQSIRNRFINKKHSVLLQEIDTLLEIHLIDPDSEKKMLLLLFTAFNSSPRILYFFLAYQYALSKTIHHSSLDVQLAYAKQLLKIVAPLTKRIGIRKLREKFETIAFSLLFPEDYNTISLQRSAYIKQEKGLMRKIGNKVRYYLKKKGIKFHISSRIKSNYSIYKKLKKKGRASISAINDLFAMRIIVEEIDDCYKCFGIIHQKFSHIPGKIKDYISLPKTNSYQSLHTILQVSMQNKAIPFEIQIRTKRMEYIAQSGMAAHLFYKKDNTEAQSIKQVKKNIIQLSNQMSSSTFLQHAEEDLFERYIFVFTTNNQIFPIARGATALDFNFALHKEKGLKIKQTLVNGEKVEFDYILQNGERIEILMNTHPSIEKKWVDQTNTPLAHKIITKHLHSQS